MTVESGLVEKQEGYMDDATGFVPPDVGDDSHIIRRLGWAVVRQWPNLPPDVRERIQKQAVFTHDNHQTVQLNEQISLFIRKHAKDV